MAIKIENEIRAVRLLNEIGSKLKKVNEEKTKLIFEKVNFSKINKKFGQQISNLNPRAFLQFVVELSNLTFQNTCNIVRYVDKKYLIQNVLVSEDLKAYMRFTPTLLKIFDYDSIQVEAAIFLSKYLKSNFTLLEEMAGTKIAHETREIMKKYL